MSSIFESLSNLAFAFCECSVIVTQLTYLRYLRLAPALSKTGSMGFTQRPNVHAMLHLVQSSQDYSTLVNVCCSPGESKHRPLKRHARKTNNQGVDKQLLRRINTLQTVRFVINGAFMDTHETVTTTLRRIQNVSPRIFGSIAPISLVAEKGGLACNGQELPCAIPDIRCLRMGLQIKQADLPSYAPTWAAPSTWIRGALDQIYNTSPQSKLPPTMCAFRLTYYKRISFVSLRGDSERYHVFKRDNMAQFQGGLQGRIINFFQANILGASDYFCLVHPLIYHGVDRVMKSTIWKIGAMTISSDHMPVVVPLMYLEHIHPMFVPYAPVEETDTASIKSSEFVWRNDWYTRRF